MIRELWAQDCVPRKLTGLFWSALFSIINQYSAGWSCLFSDCEFMSYLAFPKRYPRGYLLGKNKATVCPPGGRHMCRVQMIVYVCVCSSSMYTWSSWLYKMGYFCHLHGNSLLLLLYVHLWSCTSHPFQHTHTHTPTHAPGKSLAPILPPHIRLFLLPLASLITITLSNQIWSPWAPVTTPTLQPQPPSSPPQIPSSYL